MTHDGDPCGEAQRSLVWKLEPRDIRYVCEIRQLQNSFSRVSWDDLINLVTPTLKPAANLPSLRRSLLVSSHSIAPLPPDSCTQDSGVRPPIYLPCLIHQPHASCYTGDRPREEEDAGDVLTCIGESLKYVNIIVWLRSFTCQVREVFGWEPVLHW